MVSDKIKQIMKENRTKAIDVAKHLGITPQSLNRKFAKDNWSVQDLISVLDFLGCQLVVEYKPDTKVVLTMDDAVGKGKVKKE